MRAFSLSLLDAVFAKDTLAGGEQRLDGGASWVLDIATKVTASAGRWASAAGMSDPLSHRGQGCYGRSSAGAIGRQVAPRYPVCWLMTDERLGDQLWQALRRLPPGAGVVFRHHATPPAERRTLLRRVERIATAKRLVLIVAGGGSGKAGAHGVTRARGLRSAAAHDRRQAIVGVRQGAAVLFVSPVYATRSHPTAAPLGPMCAARIAGRLGAWVIALGGMDARRWRRIRSLGFDGWAAIDAWKASGAPSDRRQKRNTVPT